MTHNDKVFKTLEDVGELVIDSIRLEWLIKLTLSMWDITSKDMELIGVDDGDFRKFIDIAMKIPEDEFFQSLNEQLRSRKAGKK